MSIAPALGDAWRDHGDRPEEVLGRLPDLVERVAEDEAQGLVRLVLHVACEHLGRDADAAALVSRLGERYPAAAIVARGRRALAVIGGADAGAFDGADPAGDEVWVMAAALGPLGARSRWGEAERALGRAERASARLPAPHASVRLLAMAANNLAADLEARADRGPDGGRTLRAAAVAARAAWERAGTWVEAGRAEYRLVKAHLALGEPLPAMAHARTYVEICRANTASPDEAVFAWEAVAEAAIALGAPSEAQEALAAARALLAAPSFDAGLLEHATDVVDRLATRIPAA